MEYPSDTRSRGLAQLDEARTVYFQHADGDRVAHRLIHHRHVLAEPEGLFLGPPRAHSVADAEIEEVFNVVHSHIRDDAPHRGEGDLVGVGEEHVPADERVHYSNRLLRQAEVSHNLLCHSCAHHFVAVEGPVFFLIRPAARCGLADVVEERGEAHLERPLFICRRLQGTQQVLEHVERMRLILGDAYRPLELWNDVSQDAEFLRHVQGLHGPRTHEDARKFITHPLARYFFKQCGVLCDGRGGFRLYRKIELGGNAHRAQHTKRVFLETLVRVAHGRDELALHILAPSVHVDERARRRIVCDRIDGKVAAPEVVLEFFAEGHFVGMPRIRVLPFYAVRRYLDDLAPRVA